MFYNFVPFHRNRCIYYFSIVLFHRIEHHHHHHHHHVHHHGCLRKKTAKTSNKEKKTSTIRRNSSEEEWKLIPFIFRFLPFTKIVNINMNLWLQNTIICDYFACVQDVILSEHKEREREREKQPEIEWNGMYNMKWKQTKWGKKKR